MSLFTKTITYIQGSFREMKKVTWPSKKETRQYTLLVIAISIAVAIYLGALDYIFNWLLEMVI